MHTSFPPGRLRRGGCRGRPGAVGFAAPPVRGAVPPYPPPSSSSPSCGSRPTSSRAPRRAAARLLRRLPQPALRPRVRPARDRPRAVNIALSSPVPRRPGGCSTGSTTAGRTPRSAGSGDAVGHAARPRPRPGAPAGPPLLPLLPRRPARPAAELLPDSVGDAAHLRLPAQHYSSRGMCRGTSTTAPQEDSRSIRRSTPTSGTCSTPASRPGPDGHPARAYFEQTISCSTTTAPRR